MLRNSTAYTDLIARLRRKDVTLFVDTRKCENTDTDTDTDTEMTLFPV